MHNNTAWWTSYKQASIKVYTNWTTYKSFWGPNDLYKGSALTLLISLGLEDLQHAIEELDLGPPTVDQVSLAPSAVKTQKF